MIAVLKKLAKKSLRQVIRVRMNCCGLTLAQAEWYAEKIKRYPAILNELNYRRDVNLPLGVRMNVGLIDVIERSLLTTGHWDPIVESCVQQLLKPGDTFLDVGANIGYFSMMASGIVGPNGTVVSFEPSARALTRLTSHGCLNQCRNLLICSHAVGDSIGRSSLNWAPSSNIGGSTISRGKPATGAVEQITIRRLDDVCREFSLTPGLIKMDIEGFELFALRGARETLADHGPNVICELTGSFLEDHGQSARDLVQFMLDLGYTPFQLSESGSGRLVATPFCLDETPSSQAEVLFSKLSNPLG